MSDTATSKEMLNRSISAFSDDGRMSVAELDHIVEAASTDGVMDPAEKAVLMKVICKLTSHDLTPELWSRVEFLIQKFDLDDPE